MHGWCAEKENRGNSYILLPIVVSVPTFCIQYSMCLYIRYLWTSPSPYITDHTMFILVLGPFEPSGAHHSMELHGCTLVPGTPWTELLWARCCGCWAGQGARTCGILWVFKTVMVSQWVVGGFRCHGGSPQTLPFHSFISQVFFFGLKEVDRWKGEDGRTVDPCLAIWNAQFTRGLG